MSRIPSLDRQIAQAVDLLKAGQVVGMPTETVYGLAGDASNPAALSRIFSVKNRPTFDPLIIHASSFEGARGVVKDFSPVAEKLAMIFWPGPLTLVLPKADWVPDLATAGLSTVGIRVPAHPLALDLLEAFGGYLAAPSANKFGKLSPTTADAVREGLGPDVPLVLDGGACEKGLESTIIGFDGEKPVCLRLGALTLEQIAQVLGEEIPAPGQFDPRLAPGNLPAHYAPATKVRIFEAGESPVIPSGAKIAVVTFSRKLGMAGVEEFVLSEKSDLTEAAANFFQTLRCADHLEVDTIYAERFPQTGLGLALNDRLQKAANSFL
ncbi:MAG: L-threonylcarbamoyladenylate synthase [Verrucomicrobiota bacterium]|nr:L-threonylcarbamoyladenylate synthase [Verrucomicrobiota bacterium]